jgi:hypothetical protein
MKTRIECLKVQSRETWKATGKPQWWLRNVGEQTLVEVPVIPGCNVVDWTLELDSGFYVLGVGPSGADGVRRSFTVSDVAALLADMTDFETSVAAELAFAIEDPSCEGAWDFAHEVVHCVRSRTPAETAVMRREFAKFAQQFPRSVAHPKTETSNEIPEPPESFYEVEADDVAAEPKDDGVRS